MNLTGADMQLQEMRDRLAAVTAERDDYRGKFRNLEHELELERAGTVLMTQRAEAAEALLNSLQHAVANYDVSLRRSDVDFAVEIIGMWHGDLAVLGFGVDSMLQTALTNALAQLTTWEQGQQARV